MTRAITILCLLLLVASLALAQDPMDETRCCVAEIKRTKSGDVLRRADVIRKFRHLYPCPATRKNIGRCDGWAINHTIPLACGGFDSVSNMSWVPNVLKSGPGYFPIDRWERKVYCAKTELVTMPNSGRILIK